MESSERHNTLVHFRFNPEYKASADATVRAPTRVSEGCRHCYAERLAGRFSAKTEGVYAGTTKTVNGLQVWTGKINRAPEETLLKPLHWRCRGASS